jgi:PAS domain-containing protein
LTISAGKTRSNTNYIVNCNAQAKKILGYNKSELLGSELSLIQEEMFEKAHFFAFKGYMEDWSMESNLPELCIYPQTKTGFLKSMDIKVRIQPSLD